MHHAAGLEQLGWGRKQRQHRQTRGSSEPAEINWGIPTETVEFLTETLLSVRELPASRPC